MLVLEFRVRGRVRVKVRARIRVSWSKKRLDTKRLGYEMSGSHNVNKRFHEVVCAKWLSAVLYLSDFHWGGQSFDWRLATIAGMEVAKLVPWNSLLN